LPPLLRLGMRVSHSGAMMLAMPPHHVQAGRGISVAMLSVLAATSPTLTPRCIIYVDPCTGDLNDGRLNLVKESCESADVQVVSVWSAGYARMLCARSDTAADEADKIRAALAPVPGEEAAWAERLQGMHVIDVLCGSDAGLEVSERMLHALVPARSNGLLRARRDKFLMNEVLRQSGLNTAEQASASEWSEAAAFLERLPRPLAAVLKPRRGSASLRVGLARSVEAAARCFEAVLSTPSTLDESPSADSNPSPSPSPGPSPSPSPSPSPGPGPGPSPNPNPNPSPSPSPNPNPSLTPTPGRRTCQPCCCKST